AAGHSAGCPGLRFPDRDGAVLFRPDLNLAEGRGTVAPYRQLVSAIQEEPDRPSPALLREESAYRTPRVRGEFAAEPSAHVIHVGVDLGRFHLDVRRQRTTDARD